MPNYDLPKYDEQREHIKKSRKRGKTWEEIRYDGNEKGLENFLKNQCEYDYWEITKEDWINIVNLQKKAEESTLEIKYKTGQAMIVDSGEDNGVSIPKDPKSSWQLYKKNLLKNGFKQKAVDEIEKNTLRILKRLNNNTTQMPPVKGLVIGNVQSGKTANMTALMAMAADWGWNMFIVLSGTIDNLRLQTQERMLNDLNSSGNLNWKALEHLSKKMTVDRAQDLNFSEQSRQRYFTVCLKVTTRLRDLIQWLQADANQQSQMKILVIDDEADQAGINTANIKDSTSIRKINRLIRNLINGRNEKSKNISAKYRAMNYIGYTATPYANILNETGEDTLYPKDFISTLGVSDEYFGPQQIFGLDGIDCDEEKKFDGLDIVRIIDEDNLEKVKDIHGGCSFLAPEALKQSICWFMCGVACMRIWKYQSPVSMLIHTSQKTDHHEHIVMAIKKWLDSETQEQLINRCHEVWKTETEKFTIEKFHAEYPKYDDSDIKINEYPEWKFIEKELKILLGHELTNIPLDEDGDLVYHEGIHLCVDNCKNNGLNDGNYVRLAYPNKNNMPDFAPAFIVVGGQTLSRGLTIKGLVSTFFLRSVGQADTLMQMGRWFGYRKGYELLPRIWLTSKTFDQFKFLSVLDQDLRDEIQEMDIIGKSPADYGPRVKNTPKASFIRITAKNRMQSAQKTDMDFTGSYNQTYLFDNDEDVLKNNIDVTNDFIRSLGDPEKRKECNEHAKNAFIWRNIDFSIIKKYLKKYQFNNHLRVFNDIDLLIEWIDKVTSKNKMGPWNVIVNGKESSDNSVWKLPFGTVNKVSRTRKSRSDEDDNVINIGVLSQPKDLIIDVDLDGKSEELKKAITSEFKAVLKKKIRCDAGLDRTPQLMIYRIDKDSKTSKNSVTRSDLNAIEDIIGICINIPGIKKQSDYAETLSIHIKDNIFYNSTDLEDINED